MNNYKRILCFLLGIFLSVGCVSYGIQRSDNSQSNITVIEERGYDPKLVRSGAVMPLVAGSGVTIDSVQLAALDIFLLQSVENFSDVVLINSENEKEVDEAKQKLVSSPHGVFYNAKVFGEALRAPFVLCGSINTFNAEMRGGREYYPNSKVGLTIWLVDTKSGQQVWTASYAKGNQELSSNLFELFTDGSRSYSSAHKLLSQGLSASVRRLFQASNVDAGSPK